MSNDLQILSVTIFPSSPVSEEDAARHVREQLRVLIEVGNSGDVPVHVWSARQAYDFDAATGVLTLYLAEPDRALPPAIKVISDHPRVPSQIIVEPGGNATIDVPVPTSVRRRTPATGLGMSFTEEPIANIRKSTVRIQYAEVPFQHIIGESASDARERLQAHGGVVEKTVSPVVEGRE